MEDKIKKILEIIKNKKNDLQEWFKIIDEKEKEEIEKCDNEIKHGKNKS
jgi:hypothetical protein